MSSVTTVDPIVRCNGSRKVTKPRCSYSSSLSCSRQKRLVRAKFGECKVSARRAKAPVVIRASRSSHSSNKTISDTFESSGDVFFRQSFPVTRTETVDGKIFVRVDQGNAKGNWQLTVGCSLPGKWILHWGVSYVNDIGSEWDQPPKHMRPPGSVQVKNYAIDTPLKKQYVDDLFYEVKIDIDPKSTIAAINFVLKDEESGTWYQHKGRDFKVSLMDYLLVDANIFGGNSFNVWPG